MFAFRIIIVVVIGFSGVLKACILLASLHPAAATDERLPKVRADKNWGHTNKADTANIIRENRLEKWCATWLGYRPSKPSTTTVSITSTKAEKVHATKIVSKNLTLTKGITTITADVAVAGAPTDRIIATRFTQLSLLWWHRNGHYCNPRFDWTSTSTFLFTPTTGPRLAEAKQRRNYRCRVCSSVIRPKGGHTVTKVIATTAVTSTHSKKHTSLAGYIIAPKETVTTTTERITTILITTNTIASSSSILAPSTVLTTEATAAAVMTPTITTITTVTTLQQALKHLPQTSR